MQAKFCYCFFFLCAVEFIFWCVPFTSTFGVALCSDEDPTQDFILREKENFSKCVKLECKEGSVEDTESFEVDVDYRKSTPQLEHHETAPVKTNINPTQNKQVEYHYWNFSFYDKTPSNSGEDSDSDYLFYAIILLLSLFILFSVKNFLSASFETLGQKIDKLGEREKQETKEAGKKTEKSVSANQWAEKKEVKKNKTLGSFLKKKTKKKNKKRDEGDKVEVVIVGAGVAGSALAKALGDSGRKVLLIERDLSEPDRIVGELLQPRGVELLNQLGLEDAIQNIDAHAAKGYMVFEKNQSVLLPFPKKDSTSSHEGISFHHGKFIQKLRKAATECENVTVEEGTVTELVMSENKEVISGVIYRSKTGETKTVAAPLTIVCDGCFSRFRKHLVSATPTVRSKFYGLILENCTLVKEGYGHVVLATPSPILLYRIGSNEVRMLVDVPNTGPKGKDKVIDYMLTHLCHQLPIALQEPFIAALKKGDLRSMPNQRLFPSPQKKLGVVAIGDSWNIRHPLTGGGMTVALSDVKILSEVLSQVDDLEDKQKVSLLINTLFQQSRKPPASVINSLADALYGVFSNFSEDPEVNEAIRNACFSYFQLGGSAVSGPMGLLSGMIPSRGVLMYHYVSVALYAGYKLLFPLPFPSKIWLVIKVLITACKIFDPVFRNEIF